MDHKTYMKATTAVLAIAAVVHAARVYNGWSLVVGPYRVPMWASMAAVVIAGFLAWNGYKHLK